MRISQEREHKVHALSFDCPTVHNLTRLSFFAPSNLVYLKMHLKFNLNVNLCSEMFLCSTKKKPREKKPKCLCKQRKSTGGDNGGRQKKICMGEKNEEMWNRMQMQILATAVERRSVAKTACVSCLPAACRSANKNERNLYADAKTFCTPFAGNSHQQFGSPAFHHFTISPSHQRKRKNRWIAGSLVLEC